MLFTKMNGIIDEVNAKVSEREELTECIALSLLSGKNLFILGDTGQAKSFCINEFRKRITGARQFERLMSKQTDEEQLFGRLDLASIIPGNASEAELSKNVTYADCMEEVREAYGRYEADKSEENLRRAAETAKRTEVIRHILCMLKSDKPRMITDGKIPDSHIVFLDEIFKSNDGILNSLLTALNERVYTNEGETVDIPTISFFAASNEIPNFNDSAQSILKPLYDRFELKVLTSYVEEKDNRMQILASKQSGTEVPITATVTLGELYAMQDEVKKIRIPESINELMETVLCELRKNGIHVSDRKFFSFSSIVRAKAYLSGMNEVSPKDLLILKNYFWNNPSEIPMVEKILRETCENPIGTEVQKLLDMANESYDTMEESFDKLAGNPNSTEKLKPYVVFSKELFRIYLELTSLRNLNLSDSETETVTEAEDKLEKMLEVAATLSEAPLVTLKQTAILNV